MKSGSNPPKAEKPAPVKRVQKSPPTTVKEGGSSISQEEIDKLPTGGPLSQPSKRPSRLEPRTRPKRPPKATGNAKMPVDPLPIDALRDPDMPPPDPNNPNIPSQVPHSAGNPMNPPPSVDPFNQADGDPPPIFPEPGEEPSVPNPPPIDARMENADGIALPPGTEEIVIPDDEADGYNPDPVEMDIDDGGDSPVQNPFDQAPVEEEGEIYPEDDN